MTDIRAAIYTIREFSRSYPPPPPPPRTISLRKREKGDVLRVQSRPFKIARKRAATAGMEYLSDGVCCSLLKYSDIASTVR